MFERPLDWSDRWSEIATHIARKVSETQSWALEKDIKETEVHDALGELAGRKCLGMDGFTPEFFGPSWMRSSLFCWTPSRKRGGEGPWVRSSIWALSPSSKKWRSDPHG
eukprot:TRINITY_DN18026_c0_g1_i1.p1 TRINITY_DN18026_c0_g1~~TRINITY_DN18026_c0_g1_i1.p1  ORF type:complete len:109 (-),score=13.64 TRINITY_DN18026_c0_g1_i1:45-371(-)